MTDRVKHVGMNGNQTKHGSVEDNRDLQKEVSSFFSFVFNNVCQTRIQLGTQTFAAVDFRRFNECQTTCFFIRMLNTQDNYFSMMY